jgi:proteasome lid subunit RPN8/RPN11
MTTVSANLSINRVHCQQIVDHARQGYPYEVCGLVGGRDGHAEVVTSVPNASLTPHNAYEMERQAMVDAIWAFRREGREVVAIYHSHPESDAVPSEVDIAQATWEDAITLIVGLSNSDEPDLRAWTIRHGQVEPAVLTISDE